MASTMEESQIETASVAATPIKLETPILIKNKALYIPIRDFLKTLDGRLVFRKKTDSYVLELPSKTISLSPYSKKVLINETPKTLKAPPIFAMGRVYFPLDLLTKAGYKVISGEKSISIQPAKGLPSKRKRVSRKKPKPKVAKKFNIPTLPILSKKNPSSLNYKNKTYPLKYKYFYENKVLYVELLPFLKKIGYNITNQKDMVTVSHKKNVFSFYKHKKVVYTKTSSKKKTYQLPNKLITRQNKLYFPLAATLQIFDFGYQWSAIDNKIYVLGKITGIEAVNYKNTPLIKIKSTHPLTTTSPEVLLLRHGMYFDIPSSVLATDQKSIKDLGFDRISKVSLKKIDLKTTRVRLYSKDTLTAPNLVSTSTGLEITFNSQLSTITEAKKGSQTVLRLAGKGPFNVRVTKAKKASKIIVDIKNCVTTMPQVKRSSLGGFKQIRTSQFKTSPFVTRMVIDFNGSVPDISHTTSSEYIEFRINKPKKTAVSSKKKTLKTIKKKPKVYKKAPIKKKYYSKSEPLKNRIIFVDAGHGGRDPGAVASKKYYEKTYNLDIAKRLKRRLEAKGAIVIMSRSRDRTLSLSGRSYLANKNKADIMVSIHINSFVQSRANGTETYYYKYKDKRLATHIQKQLAKDLKRKNNGVKRARLYILRNAHMPSALVEPVFMTNSAEHQLLKSPNFRQRIADSVYQGVYNYFKASSK
jgi:N-acetylmuramoyl-L-alanine amidase CwlD